MTDSAAELAALWRLLETPEGDRSHPRAQAYVARFPHEPDAWVLLGWSALRSGRAAEALAASDRAIALGTHDAAAILCRAACLQRLGRSRESRLLVATIGDSQKLRGMQYAQLGELLAQQEQYQAAAIAYSRAVAAQPGNASLFYNLATVQRFVGDLAGAEASCDEALRLQPADPDACYLRSGLRRQEPGRNHIAELLAARTRAATPRAISSLEYALAKEYEDIGDFAAAFQAMARAGAVRRAHMTYDVTLDEEIIHSIISTFKPEYFSGARAGDAEDSPIFIVGMPRTGTTLLERIICNDPTVRSAGERSDLGALVSLLARRIAGVQSMSALDTVRFAARIDCSELGRRYVESVAAADSTRFIDKFPLNFLYVGLIHVALPQARIVHLTRDPLDTCVAIYKQKFENAHPYSYDLDDIGRYYLAYRRLMDHWRRALPGRLCEVSYEDLVQSTDSTCRKVFEFCGLRWQPGYAHGARTGYIITTASASQARDQIHARSIGTWRNYERYLTPLRDRLRAAGVR